MKPQAVKNPPSRRSTKVAERRTPTTPRTEKVQFPGALTGTRTLTESTTRGAITDGNKWVQGGRSRYNTGGQRGSQDVRTRNPDNGGSESTIESNSNITSTADSTPMSPFKMSNLLVENTRGKPGREAFLLKTKEGMLTVSSEELHRYIDQAQLIGYGTFQFNEKLKLGNDGYLVTPEHLDDLLNNMNIPVRSWFPKVNPRITGYIDTEPNEKGFYVVPKENTSEPSPFTVREHGLDQHLPFAKWVGHGKFGQDGAFYLDFNGRLYPADKVDLLKLDLEHLAQQ